MVASACSPCSRAMILLYIYLLLFANNYINSVIGAKVRYYKFEVEYIHWSPDCVDNIVIGINGQFPGPTIRAEVGDTVQVDLINKFDIEGVVIHWHGIRQFGTPWADGTASISQCAINPGESFTYSFIVPKAGTYFYHAHYGLQRSAGLYGSLIVEVGEGEKEPFHYDGEFSLLFSDWWHEDSHQQAVDLSTKPFRWIGEPQSLLMNGRGQFNCSLAAANCTTNSQCTPQILNVQPNKTYRLRLASSTSLASLNFAIGSHKLLVVEADGNYVQPFAVDNMDIYSGESYSILFTTNHDPNNNYWISISIRGRLPKTPQGLSILNYSPNSPSKLPTSPPPISPLWNDFTYSKEFSNKILALMGSPKPPINYDRRISLLNTQNLIDGYTKWTINNVSLSLPATPYLGSIRYGLKNAFDTKTPPQDFPMDYDITKPPINPNSTYGNRVYMLSFNTTIDVILQNANALNPNVSEIHPWHLHGHDFWVLAYGEGKFRKEEDEKKFNLKNPPLRNTVVIFPYGWTALRFVADNPGVWAFHCHIEPHLHMGMGVVFAEGVGRLKKVPKEAIGCGLSGKMLMSNKHG